MCFYLLMVVRGPPLDVFADRKLRDNRMKRKIERAQIFQIKTLFISNLFSKIVFKTLNKYLFRSPSLMKSYKVNLYIK